MHKVKPATAKAYLNSIRSYHLENGISTAVLNDPRIDLVLRGGKRVHGEGERRIRLPLIYDILLRITRETRNDFDGLNIKTALCVAFAGFLRSGEFTWETWDATSSAHHLARQHVEFINDSVNLTLPASKTEPFRNGVIILQPSPPITLLKVIGWKPGFGAPSPSVASGISDDVILLISVGKIMLKVWNRRVPP
jgi:hypothetical protein